MIGTRQGERPIHVRPRAEADREIDELLAAQFADADRRARGQRVVRATHQPDRVGGERGKREARRRPRQGHEGHVEVPGTQFFSQLRGSARGGTRADLDQRTFPVVAGHDLGQVDKRQGLHQADAERAAQSAPDVADRASRGIGVGEDTARLRQQGMASVAEHNLVRGALEQPRTKIPLQRPDGDGQSRLAQVHPPRRLRKAAFLRSGDEMLKLAKFHDPILPAPRPVSEPSPQRPGRATVQGLLV
jgi:hypothetical protein